MLVHKSHKVGVTFRKRLCCSYIKHFVQVLVYRQFGNLSTEQTNGKANHHYLEVNPGSATIRWVFKTAQTFHQLKRLTFARFLPLVKKDKIKSSKLSGSLCPIYRKLNLFQPLLFHLVLNDQARLRMDGEGWSVVYYVKSKSLTQSHPRSEKPRFFAAFQPFSCNAGVLLNIFLDKTCLLINSLIIPTIPAAVTPFTTVVAED